MAEPKHRQDSRKHRRKGQHGMAGKQRRRDKKYDQKVAGIMKRLASESRPDCPYCGRRSRFVENTRELFGSNIGPVWVCNGYPKCDAYVMCHTIERKYGLPLGTLANKDLRKARMFCHRQLDHLWKSGRMTRDEVYLEMADAMDLHPDDAHVAMFDLGQCEEAAAFARRRLKEIYGSNTNA